MLAEWAGHFLESQIPHLQNGNGFVYSKNGIQDLAPRKD